jgi:hypothetical protein
MQSDPSLLSPQSDDSASAHESSSSPTNAFTITREGVQILQTYLDDFEDGNADFRTTLVARAMADLAALHPRDVPFNKLDASMVSICTHHHKMQMQNTDVCFIEN